MRTNESVERDALDELARIERFEELVASGEQLEEAEVASALYDASEPIRAEALDYLIGISPTTRMVEIVERVGGSETAVQCVARIAFLSYAWHKIGIRACLSYRPTLDEAEYIAVWDDAGKTLLSGDLGAAVRLCTQAEYGDWELRTVADNLIEMVVEMGSETQSIFDRISTSFASFK